MATSKTGHFQVLVLYRLTTQVFGIRRKRISARPEKWSHENSLLDVEKIRVIARPRSVLENNHLITYEMGSFHLNLLIDKAKRRILS